MPQVRATRQDSRSGSSSDMQGSERGIMYDLNVSLCFATGTTGRGALSPLINSWVFIFVPVILRMPCDLAARQQ